ncbi:DUF1588 domain-containing protein [bacterium]|nr:DUF1588 domain-containing protein [bacterium]
MLNHFATSQRALLIACAFAATATNCRADDFDSFLSPLFHQHCVGCHGNDEANGKVNLQAVANANQFLEQPALIKELIDVIDANDMPPEGETPLGDGVRAKLLRTLKQSLREATAGKSTKRLPVRRLNRFQYNNAVRDIFQLNRDVFSLPEKLMTRHSDYLATADGRMPDRVSVASHSLEPEPGLKDVVAFPKDLRASHGFDNQANQLTLSPLLLDAFLRLSVSIVDSPDFNEQTVGIWNDFFAAPPAAADVAAEVRKRLASFLTLTFRQPVDDETLGRYVSYVTAKTQQGLSLTDAMRKVASAALSSPLFLYRFAGEAEDDPFALASRLSFCLWGSGPDRELLELAGRGELSQPETLRRTIDRMMADPRIERFLDSFPAQWMQLENVLGAAPDPQMQRYFSLDSQHPAGLQMLLEPLLLFDAVFIEDRPIAEFIQPQFSYQSDFLRTWYTSDLTAPQVDRAKVASQNRQNDQRRQEQQAIINATQAKLKMLVDPVKERLLEARRAETGQKPVDLNPFAAWEFDGDLKSSVGSLDLNANGEIAFEGGTVVLNKSFLQSPGLPIELKAKTLEVWCIVPNLDQPGGGVMGVQGPGGLFDTIVIGERKPRHWISGSNGFQRTEDFPESTPEDEPNQLLHLVMVYTDDATTTLYRNGEPYGKPFSKGLATFPKDASSILFGLRHLPPGGNRFLSVSIDKARLYDRALTAAEVASSFSGFNSYITDDELLAALPEDQRAMKKSLDEMLATTRDAFASIHANQDADQLQQLAQQRFDDAIRAKLRARGFDRVPVSDTRYGGVITNAAIMSMTSGPKRTHPIARGAWVIEVILNDPPPPPPNDVPPLNEDASDANLTIREKFKVHRENPDCAGCHSRLDPLGFALENFDITGRWRDTYENGRNVDAGGRLMRKHDYATVVDFKSSLLQEKRRFARAFTGHLLRFALARELRPADSLTIDEIVDATESDNFRLRSLIRHTVLCDSFRNQR